VVSARGPREFVLAAGKLLVQVELVRRSKQEIPPFSPPSSTPWRRQGLLLNPRHSLESFVILLSGDYTIPPKPVLL
jgi:hypothetical protein